MVPLLKMPGGIFAISMIVIMLFIFVDSRVTGDKKSYSYYIKYGIFVGAMNTLIFYISHNMWPTLPQVGAGSGVMSAGIVNGGIVTGLPGIF